jgi:TfoX/Sxy family transcriptional regulator of competence genes
VPFDEQLADRVRARLDTAEGVTEKRMFGGLAFLIGGNMAVAASSRGGLMVRVPPERTDELLGEPGAGPFEMRGKPMSGWLRVDGDALDGEEALARWVETGAAYARSLPAK